VLVLHNHESVVRTRKGSQRQDLSDAVRKECPHARVVEFDPELVAVAKRWQNRSRDLLSEHLGACPAYGVQKTLLKWAALDPRIYTSRLGRPPIALFLDSDVDATWHSSVVAQIMSGRLNVSQKLDAFVNDPSCQAVATPDRSSPMNTGVMVLKPSKSIYEEGLELLRTRVFTRRSGFNQTGSVRQALNTTMSSLAAGARRRIAYALGFKDDTWDFFCGDADQGLFTTMFMARGTGRYCAPRLGTRVLSVRHFWWKDKPWHDPPSCPRYFAFLNQSSAAAGEDALAAETASSLDSSGLETSPCSRYLRMKARKIRLVPERRCRGEDWPVV